MKGKAALFIAVCRAHGLPEPEAEHRFAPPRRWRFDFSWPEHKVALENDGGLFVGGRHARGAGIILEHEKFNTAATMGWRILRCTPQTLCTKATIETVKACLALK